MLDFFDWYFKKYFWAIIVEPLSTVSMKKSVSLLKKVSDCSLLAIFPKHKYYAKKLGYFSLKENQTPNPPLATLPQNIISPIDGGPFET